MGSLVSRPKFQRQSLASVAATDPSLPSTLRRPLPALPAELLLIVFELAHETAALSVLRAVSRQFNQLVVPIIYHQVTLTDRVIACFQITTPERSPSQLQVAKDICKHTRHISIDKELHWPSVLKLLYSLDKLQELRYVRFFNTRDPALYGALKLAKSAREQHANIHLSSLSYWAVSLDAEPSIHNALFFSSSLRKRWPGLKLHVERHDTSTALPLYPLLKSVANVISCKTIIWSENEKWFRSRPTIKDALLANPQLQTLHLFSNGEELNDVKWDKRDSRKLPPVKELVICNLLGWGIFSICDWSNVTHLELVNVSCIALIESLPAGKLSKLKTLIIACVCWDRAERQNRLQKLSDFLNTLLTNTRDLEKLALKCGVCDFRQSRRGCSLTFKSEEHRKLNDCVSTIARGCQSLQSLELRNSDEPDSSPWKWILFSPNDLEAIGCGCPGLMELSLDAKMYFYGRQTRLDMGVTAALASFRNLRRLTVYTIMPYLPPEPGLLPYHQARAIAREWTENIQRLKKGAKFVRLMMNIEIERLVAEDEFERVYDDDDWRVYFNYTWDAAEDVSWSVTGEERALEFIRR